MTARIQNFDHTGKFLLARAAGTDFQLHKTVFAFQFRGTAEAFFGEGVSSHFVPYLGRGFAVVSSHDDVGFVGVTREHHLGFRDGTTRHIVELEVVGADGGLQVGEHVGLGILDLADHLVEQGDTCGGDDVVEVVCFPILLLLVVAQVFRIDIQTHSLFKVFLILFFSEFQDVGFVLLDFRFQLFGVAFVDHVIRGDVEVVLLLDVRNGFRYLDLFAIHSFLNQRVSVNGKDEVITHFLNVFHHCIRLFAELLSLFVSFFDLRTQKRLLLGEPSIILIVLAGGDVGGGYQGVIDDHKSVQNVC